jgi:hypothetical protein
MFAPRSSRYLTALVLAPVLVTTLVAQSVPSPPLSPPVQSDLLDQLAGAWDITGTTGSRPVHERADAEWVLGHEFLRIHRKQLDGPGESVVHVGFDTFLKRFVAFRVDSLTGAHGAETLGYGLQKADNKLEFDFEYPSSLWRETWTWDAKEKTWQFMVEVAKKDPKGINYTPFSTLTLRRIQGGRGGGRGFAPQRPQAPPFPQPPQP